MRTFAIALGLILGLSGQCQAYSSGYVSAACSTMTPGHDLPQQDSASNPYTLQLSVNEIDAGSGEVSLTLSGATFKGFFIHAYDTSDDSLVGEFSDLGS